MRLIDGTRTLGSVTDARVAAGDQRDSVEADARTLVERGVLDLLR